MKKVLILATAIVMCAGLASAQPGGHIGLYSDVGYADCNLVPTLFVDNLVYVVHRDAAEGNTAQFKVSKTWPQAGDGSVDAGGNLTLGAAYTGILVTYVGCKALPHLLLTLKPFPFQPTPPCTVAMEIVPDPNLASGNVEVVNCSSTILLATGGKLTVNGDESCPCVVATEETNWSRIKALYQ